MAEKVRARGCGGLVGVCAQERRGERRAEGEVHLLSRKLEMKVKDFLNSVLGFIIENISCRL
jgi:hypothetical protein